MRRSLVTTLAVLVFAAGSSAAGQQVQDQVGLGLGLVNTSLANLDTALMPVIYAPLVISAHFMIEPGFGMVRLSESDDNFDETLTALTLGVGFLYLMPLGDSDRLYVGPRVGFVRLSESFSGPGVDEDDSSNNLWLSGVVGGEFFLRPRFSLGGEVGVRWLDASAGGDELDSSILSTTTEFRVRWYF